MTLVGVNVNVIYIHKRGATKAVVEQLDELGKPAWIALMILGFIVWWPLGLVTLAFILGSGRMGCWRHNGGGHWQDNMGRWQAKMERMQDKMERLRGRMDRARQRGGSGFFWGGPPSSGNRAFDDYRSETLQRLEEEQREFKDFLERLRFAKDRAEFDQFMAERRKGASDPGQGPQPQAS